MKNELKNLKSLLLKITLNIVLAAIALYFTLQFLKTTGDAIETERADMAIRRDIVEIHGYIFRNEEIIYSPGGNAVNYFIENGGKVGKNQLVAQSNQNTSDLFTKEQINSLTEKLEILHKSNINLDFITTSVNKIDDDSRAIYVGMLKSIETGRIKDAGKNRNDLLIMLNKRQLITGAVSGGFDGLINSTSEKIEQLEARTAVLGTGSFGIYSNQSGIFYSKADGYENFFNADAIKSLDFDKFAELIKKEPDSNILHNALGKVAYDFNWYLVCKTEKNSAFDFTVGKTYDIVYPFSPNRSTESALVRQIGSTNSNEIILIFETAHIPFDFDFSRKQTIQIIFNEIEGIKVPEEALRVVEKEDGTTAEGVYIRRGGLVIFRELPPNECLGKFEGYYIYLEPSERPNEGGGKLQLYEDIITAGKDLYDGKVID